MKKKCSSINNLCVFSFVIFLHYYFFLFYRHVGFSCFPTWSILMSLLPFNGFEKTVTALSMHFSLHCRQRIGDIILYRLKFKYRTAFKTIFELMNQKVYVQFWTHSVNKHLAKVQTVLSSSFLTISHLYNI